VPEKPPEHCEDCAVLAERVTQLAARFDDRIDEVWRHFTAQEKIQAKSEEAMNARITTRLALATLALAIVAVIIEYIKR